MNVKILRLGLASLSFAVFLVLASFSYKDIASLVLKIGDDFWRLFFLSSLNVVLVAFVVVFALGRKIRNSNPASLTFEVLRASLLNMAMPFLGTSLKVALLKFDDGLEVSRSFRILVFAGTFRVSGALSVAIAGITWNLSGNLFTGIISALLAFSCILIPLNKFSFPIAFDETEIAKRQRAWFSLLFLSVEVMLFLTQTFVLAIILLNFDGIPELPQLLFLVGISGVLSIVPSAFLGIGLREGALFASMAYFDVGMREIASGLVAERLVFVIALTVTLTIAALISWRGKLKRT